MADELEHTVKCKPFSSHSPKRCEDSGHMQVASAFYTRTQTSIVFPLNLTCLIIRLQKVITVMCRWDHWFKNTIFCTLLNYLYLIFRECSFSRWKNNQSTVYYVWGFTFLLAWMAEFDNRIKMQRSSCAHLMMDQSFFYN